LKCLLDGGRALGGSFNHCAKGSYVSTDDTVQVNLSVQVFGTPPALFGERQGAFDIVLEGKQVNNVMNGTFSRRDKRGTSLTFRATRRADLA
jgi:hypothetical protein